MALGSSAEPFDVAVIGAGIGGLSLAYQLKRFRKSVCVLEASDRVGGVISSAERDGYLLELGPNTVLGKPVVLELLKQLKLESEIVPQSSTAKNRYLAVRSEIKNTLIPFPRSVVQAISTPLLTLRAKGRLLTEPFRRSSSCEDQSVSAFLETRIGELAVRRVVGAMFAGVWAADITTLSARSSIPMLWDWVAKSGSLYRGALGKLWTPRDSSKPKGRASILSFRAGLQTLPTALQHELGESVKLNSRVYSIEHREGMTAIRIEGQAEAIFAKQIVIACDAENTARLIESQDAGLAHSIRSIPYAPLGMLHFCCSRTAVQHPLDGFGFLAAPEKGYALLGTIFSSALFPSAAPPGQVLLTAFCGGAVNPQYANVTDVAVQQRAEAELIKILGISAPLQILSANYWPRAIPNYAVGHFRVEQAVADFERRFSQVCFLGNWLRGISLGDRIKEANALADRLLS